MSDYPIPAFHFGVYFGATLGLTDTSFQDVSGIDYEIETEAVVEGGENRFVHQLPKGVKHGNLVLKRGIGKMTSPLVIWCMAVFQGDLIAPIVPMPLNVSLLNENRIPIRCWSFSNAYPVKWQTEGFNSTKNEVAIETIELAYSYCIRAENPIG